MSKFPSDAFSPSGKLWWELLTYPNSTKRRFGIEVRLAAWLKFNAVPGDIFTLRKLRQALGGAAGRIDDEHFNRRLRALRKYGWVIHSGRDAGDLKQDEYRLASVGDHIWLGKAQFSRKAISAKVRREVFDRDGRRCVVCGIGAGEPYPDQPSRLARLTIGHLIAGSLKGSNDPSNLRTECSRCNEPSREEAVRSESAAEIWPKLRSLSRKDKARLLSWVEIGHRERDVLDRLYDQIRSLPAPQRDELRSKLRQAATASD